MSSADASYDAANKGPLLLGVWWAEVGVATVFVAMRFYTRFTMRSLGADDWTILLTLVSCPYMTPKPQSPKPCSC